MWLSRPELYYLFYWFLFLYTELTDYEWWSVRIDESNGHRWSWIQVNIFQKISFIINIFQRIYVQLLWWNKEASWLEVIFLVISQKSKPNLNVHQKKAIFWNLDWFFVWGEYCVWDPTKKDSEHCMFIVWLYLFPPDFYDSKWLQMSLYVSNKWTEVIWSHLSLKVTKLAVL